VPALKRPGVYAEEILNLSQMFVQPTSGVAAFVAAHSRGPTTPVYVESWSQFLQRFGGFGAATEYLPFAVYQFFANGGRQAYIVRAAGPAAVKATRTLNDNAATPLATLRVDAENSGVWAGGATGVFVEVTLSGTDRFNLIVRFGGAADQYIVERWLDLSMNDNDGRYVENVINSPTNGSTFIRVADLDSTTPAPADRPAILAPTSLTGGTDPVVTQTELNAALNTLDTIEGPLTINMPGVTSATGALNAGMQDLLLTYCSTRGDCFAVLDPPEAESVANVISQAGARNSAYGALYYPWVYMSDPASSSQGAVRKLPPGGAVVGQYSMTDTLRGVHKAPAGIGNRLAGAVGIETKLTNANLDDLNLANVNAIRHMPGVGIAIMGARTLKSTASDRYVSVRRTLNYIRKALIDGTRWAVFEPNDQVLWSGLRTNVTQFLLSMWQRGALRGGSAEEAFYVKCDASNNTPQSIASGQVNLEVGLALQFPAEFVVIRIGQWEGGVTATVAA
jgi:phage tail sheath protein FI